MNKEQEPTENPGLIRRISRFYHSIRQRRQFDRDIKPIIGEANTALQKIDDDFSLNSKQAKTLADSQQIEAKLRQDLITWYVELVKKIPRENDEPLAQQLLRLGEQFQKKFKLTSNESDRFESQMCIRAADAIRRLHNE